MSFIGVYENIIPVDFCEEAIAFYELISKNHSGVSGESQHGGVAHRKDVSFFLDVENEEMNQKLNGFLDIALQEYMEEHPALGMCSFYSNCSKLQKTSPKGGFHQWHCERQNGQATNRILVWMVYLNNCPDGEGTTEFIEQGVRLQPKAGTVVFFPADWTHTHRGNPVYNSDKYILTGWYYQS